jgi:hypothetical protein
LSASDNEIFIFGTLAYDLGIPTAIKVLAETYRLEGEASARNSKTNEPNPNTNNRKRDPAARQETAARFSELSQRALERLTKQAEDLPAIDFGSGLRRALGLQPSAPPPERTGLYPQIELPDREDESKSLEERANRFWRGDDPLITILMENGETCNVYAQGRVEGLPLGATLIVSHFKEFLTYYELARRGKTSHLPIHS